ncbi:MAG: hypothetical protein M3453_02180 [Pseudomonadota bacterium]|nr:hypothetical protein [Pseudomonadota bacterium]
MTAGYRRVQAADRSRHDASLGEAVAGARGFLPLSRARFEARLEAGLAEAKQRGIGFTLGGFAARRALGKALIIDTDPRLIEFRLEHRVSQGDCVTLIRDRFLGAGDWRPILSKIRNSSTYQEVEAIARAGLDYRRTDAFRTAMERAGSQKPVNRNFVALKSPELVESYFRQTAELCRSVQEHGLLRRSDHGRRLGESLRHPRVRLPWVELGESEIGAAIGQAGEIYRFASGKHRTAAAQALGLTSMPVEVRMVHANWLEKRMAESGLRPTEALLLGVRGLDRKSAEAVSA